VKYALLLFVFLSTAAFADTAREIEKQLRCLVCQSESVADSESDFAKDVRGYIQTRLKAGDNEEKIIADLRTRYGDFILLKPPVLARTWLLWLTPIAVFAAGVMLSLRISRGSGRSS
jgi:cytochrome c-type biogenesis protein CcmH